MRTVAALRARMDALFASEGVRLALAGASAPDFRALQNEGKIAEAKFLTLFWIFWFES